MTHWIRTLTDLQAQNRRCVMVTVSQCAGSTPREVGAKMIVLENTTFFGTIGGGHLEQLALQEAATRLHSGQSGVVRYPLGPKTGQCCGGVVDLFFEVVGKTADVYVFGAGHVGQALSRVLDGTPFRVHLIDERDEWINAPQVPQDVVKHASEWDDFVKGARFDAEHTYVAIMTHRHDIDEAIVEALLDKPLRYFGLIGSETKWRKFQERLGQRGASEAQLSRVICPIGLDIGGKSPQEVAISIASELLKLHYGR